MKEWKKNLRKRIAQLLVLVILISAMPITMYASTVSGNGYTFDTTTGRLFIETEAGATAWRNDNRFSKEDVRQVELDRPVINIPDNAFEGCINLTGGIKLNAQGRIGINAFKDCDKLEQILIPLAAVADIGTAGISTNTAYMVYKTTGDFEIFVTDVFMGNQSKIIFDGILYYGNSTYDGITLVCKDEYQIDVIDRGSAWYYQGDGEEITITRYVPSNSLGVNKNITLPTTLAGKTVVGYGTDIFADERLDASYVISYEEGTNIVLPDKVSKCIIMEEDEKKVAYLYKGSEGTLDIEEMNFGRDIAVIYAKDIILSNYMMGENTFFSYTQDAEGNVTITDVVFPRFGIENDYSVPTTINENPVTTVMINQFINYNISEIVVDPTVNKIIYEFNTSPWQTSSPVIVNVSQGSEQKSVQIPSKLYDKPIGDVESSVFDESVKCVVVNKNTSVEVPADVSKVIYEIESDGNVVITEVIAGIDGNGEKISVEIPEAIGGSKPEMSPEAREAMKNIPHEHKDNNCVCGEISDVDVSIDTPAGNQPFDTTAETTTTGIESIEVTWTDTEGNPITAEKANFYPWTYVLNLTIKPADGYVLSQAINVSINNGSIACETLTWNQDGTCCTVKSYDIISTKRELVRVDAPNVRDNRFSNFYDTKEDVLQGAVGNKLAYSTMGHFADGGSADVNIEWSVVGEYDPTPNAVNTFKWTVTGLGYYEVSTNIVLEGTVEMTNRAYDVFEYTADGFEGTYDGLEHGIEVDVVGDGAEITYSTDGVNYGVTNPTFTEAGEYIVYYKIEKENCETIYGSETVKISKREIGITAGNQSIVWGNTISQNAYAITGDGLAGGDTIALTLNASTTTLTTNGTISVSGIKIVRGTGDTAVDVTVNYVIATPVSGTLTIIHDESLAPTKIEVIKTKTSYIAGQTLNVDDITVTDFYADGYSEVVTGFTTNVDSIDMNTVGDKKLVVSYSKNGGTVNVEITISVDDIMTPTVEIAVKDNKWTQLLNTITFGLFFNETQDVIITATDANSSIDKIYYYISKGALTEDEVKALTTWKEYTEKFSIAPDDTYVIYAKVVDAYNNTTYVSSNGMVIDKQIPAISGIEDGKTYYTQVTFGVADSYLDRVFVDDKEVSLTDGKYTIYADNKAHTIKAIDKAGNETTYVITVKRGIITHTATGYEGIYDGKSHGITVTVTAPADVKISYSTDKGNDKTYSEENPVFKEIGEYIVYYKLEKENYETVYGSSKLTISHNTTLAPTKIEVSKTTTSYNAGQSLNVDDITVTAFYADGYSEVVTGFTTNVDSIDMNTVGDKKLVVSYSKNGGTVNAEITISVEEKQEPEKPPVEYEIIDGANSSFVEDSEGNIAIRGNGEVEDFLYVKVNGEIIDASNYTVTEGSTIITFTNEYLVTLNAGTHTVELVWNDGSASTSLIIAEKVEPEMPDEPDVPNTGDKTYNHLWLILLIGCGLTAVGFWKKKKYFVKK